MDAGLTELFRYNRWANLALVAACQDLAEEQLTAQPPGVSGTIGELLVHIVGGQQTFILRTKGRQHEGSELRRESAWPGMKTLTDLIRSTSDELIEIADEFEDRQVVLPYLGRHFEFPLRFILAHAIEHGTEHRTEIKVALNQLGIETPDLDGWAYAGAMSYGEEV